jgi:hypothetical protein
VHIYVSLLWICDVMTEDIEKRLKARACLVHEMKELWLRNSVERSPSIAGQ